MDAQAKQHTPAGALAFATYYFRAYDWGIATNDSYLVDKIGAKSCTACQRFADGVAGAHKQHGYFKGGRINVASARLVTGSFRFKSDYVVEVTADEAALLLVRPSVAPTTAAPAATHDVSLVFVSWLAGHGWRVVEVGAPS